MIMQLIPAVIAVLVIAVVLAFTNTEDEQAHHAAQNARIEDIG